MLLTVTLNPTVDKNYYIDALQQGEVNRVTSVAQTPGGKGIQVAKVAKLLGEEVIATGFLGGNTGSYIEGFLKDAGIGVDFIHVPGATRTAINVKDASNGKTTELIEPGTLITPELRQALLDKFEKLVADCEIAVIAGSVPKGIDENFYPELIGIAKKAGKTVLLDTSGKLLAAGIEALPDMIKPNRTEMAELIGRTLNGKEEIIEAATKIKAKGISNVIVSLGRDGAMFVTAEGVYQGTTPDIKIVNTVGCGDSLVAGFATGLARKLTMEETIKLAMAVSTANALRPETGYFIQEDLKKLLTMVQAIKLK